MKVKLTLPQIGFLASMYPYLDTPSDMICITPNAMSTPRALERKGLVWILPNPDPEDEWPVLQFTPRGYSIQDAIRLSRANRSLYDPEMELGSHQRTFYIDERG